MPKLMMEASNRGIPKEVVEANQHWSKHQCSPGVLPAMGMMERYLDACANVGYLVKYSGKGAGTQASFVL